jgi:aminoglycoside phosphotransferase (APT) family kinase protein
VKRPRTPEGGITQHDAKASLPKLARKLRAAGLIPPDGQPHFTALTGGVASDIWKVETGGTPFVVKRALPKLRVAAEWRVPISRNQAEAGWLRVAKGIVPDAVPDVLFHDARAGLFAMSFYPPERYPDWKSELRNGRVDLAFAQQVGRIIAKIHSATAGDTIVQRQFSNDETFHAIRLEPYLEATARRHPALSEPLFALARTTLACHRALVHGDVSPKNILAGPSGPVFLDAECAWYGDPAFDAAFCLNHLLLKCLWNRAAAPELLAAFAKLSGAYLAGISFEPAHALEARAARLLPALLLARIDGKSPVEYITDERDRALIRGVSAPLIRCPPQKLRDVCEAWASALGSQH